MWRKIKHFRREGWGGWQERRTSDNPGMPAPHTRLSVSHEMPKRTTRTSRTCLEGCSKRCCRRVSQSQSCTILYYPFRCTQFSFSTHTKIKKKGSASIRGRKGYNADATATTAAEPRKKMAQTCLQTGRGEGGGGRRMHPFTSTHLSTIRSVSWTPYE